jgi:[2-(trimethylamino)ethyl]phosphonate dioxygenase
MASSAGLRRIATAPECLTIEWEDGRTSEFASLWLRDNVREDRDPHNGQRLVDITDLPEEPRIRSAAAAKGVVRVDWEDDSRGACFELDWLAAHAFGGGQPHNETALLRRKLAAAQARA